MKGSWVTHKKVLMRNSEVHERNSGTNNSLSRASQMISDLADEPEIHPFTIHPSMTSNTYSDNGDGDEDNG